MTDFDAARGLEAIVRTVATAAKTLRLYPPSSPMPRQSAEGAATALAAFLAGEPVLSLAVARDGLTRAGEAVAPGSTGTADFADLLRSHGIAEIDFLPGCSTEELLAFLTAVTRAPEELRAEGGLAAVMTAEGVEGVRVTDVALTVAEDVSPEEVGDVDEFLRQLASDPDKLTAWISAAAKGDPAALAEGLAELYETAGGESGALPEALARAFSKLDAEGKDALLGVAMGEGVVRRLAERAFGLVGTEEIAGALCSGLFGQNMLSLSSALTRLPLADRMRSVFAEVQQALEAYGRGGKEAAFLEHMVQVRTDQTPEPPLADAEAYRETIRRADVASEELGRVRGEAADGREVTRRSVTTMLTLLDQQRDFELFCRAADALALTVPTLLGQGDLRTASRVLGEMVKRQSAEVQPWPGLDERLRASIAKAFTGPAMRGLLETVAASPELAADAAELVRLGGDASAERIGEEGVGLKEEGLAAAETLIGRRLVDQLVAIAPRAQWYQVGPVVRRLAQEPDGRARDALLALMRRPDEQSRREAAGGLAGAGPDAAGLLAEMLSDASLEVAMAAARSLAKCGGAAAVRSLETRLAALDVDGKDFLLARELIAALARIPGGEAASALRKLASRKALIKRGHFAEVRQLAAQAIELQAKTGGAA
ncbi:MAG: HEAT repeat domain-containing protein [Coriobacteriia bacterium]|nr:HEAT repeat domain-containing protein [Coriobacteriia bacterium]